MSDHVCFHDSHKKHAAHGCSMALLIYLHCLGSMLVSFLSSFSNLLAFVCSENPCKLRATSLSCNLQTIE